MEMPDLPSWLASERRVLEQVAQARLRPEEVCLLRETCPSSLQNYFILRCRGRQWVGRRGVSDARHMPANAIGARDLLGDSFRFGLGVGEAQLEVSLRASADASVFLAMAARDPSAELVFPFPALDARGREWVCPPQYWGDVSQRAETLADDELHLRAVCARTLQEALPAGALVHDPACSTGDFVTAMARACPALRFTASDLSPAMVDVARRRHGRLALNADFTCADATALRARSVDGLLVRFLNAEVVTRKQALIIFRRLAGSVRAGGVVVLFGHSGVLIPVHAEAARLGWQVLASTAPTADGKGLFQWYVIRAAALR
jgi:hypothetical protein